MSKAKILVVEDENIIALEIMKRLVSLDYEVEGLVNKGNQAVEFVKNNEVDLILMDIKLQGEIDGIEAASRTLKNPTISKLEKFVWSHIMERVSNGQLNQCPLTMRDLGIIKTTFVQILGSTFHTRIAYPDSDGENS